MFIGENLQAFAFEMTLG